MSMKKIKNGSYSVVLSVVAIIAVILVNMIVGKIPATITKIDVSEQKLFSVGEQTKKLVSEVTQDVEIYMLAQEGAQDTTVEELLNRYAALSDHIHVELKDPILYPDFASKYTDERMSDNSVLVVSGDKVKAIDYYDMYAFTTDYTTYEYTATAFDGEGQITSAIAYVTSPETPVMYVTEGHGEFPVSESLKSAVKKENMEIQQLSLLTNDGVPEDASLVFLYAPTSDLTADEMKKLQDYLRQGGRMLWITAYTDQETPNLDTLLGEYGLEKVDGIVLEEDSNYHMPNYPNYLLPTVDSTVVTQNVAGRYVLAPMAQGLRQTIESTNEKMIRQLLATSDKAYSKLDVGAATMERAEGDIDGPFMLGAAVAEIVTGESGESTEARLVVYSAEYLLDEQMDAMVSGNNIQLAMDSISWLSGREVTVSIPAKSMEANYLTLTANAAIIWGILVTAVVPLGLLVSGGIICYSRRKK